MRIKPCGLVMAIAIGIGWTVPAERSQAADPGVKVTLPSFEVKLNGHVVENRYREYPLLVYKDITYFPMTWYDTRLLGLEAGWSPEKGLSIAQAQVAASYHPYAAAARNADFYLAELAGSAVTVNGKTVNNTQEEYPLLSFRDVTYFPMTWRFAHDEFGWDYRWDDAEGLSVQSRNPQMADAGLPASAGKNDAALYQGYYYYTEADGNTNRVYRAPEQHPADKQEVYSYNASSGYGVNLWVRFDIREDGLWLVYHLGGATMGRDVFVKIGGDGQAEVRHSGYLDFRHTPYGTLKIHQGVPPSANNLTLHAPGEEDHSGHPVGDSGLMYARHVTVSEGSIGVGGDDSSTTVMGDHVYVMASKPYTDLNKIYKVNLKTNETIRIVDAGVTRFRILDGRLYYVKDADRALYVSALDGTGERKLSDREVFGFDVTEGGAFYTSGTEGNGRYLYKADLDGEDPLLVQERIADVRIRNGELVCLLDGSEEHGAVVLDGSGRLILVVADPVKRLLASDSGILFGSSGSDGEENPAILRLLR